MHLDLKNGSSPKLNHWNYSVLEWQRRVSSSESEVEIPKKDKPPDCPQLLPLRNYQKFIRVSVFYNIVVIIKLNKTPPVARQQQVKELSFNMVSACFTAPAIIVSRKGSRSLVTWSRGFATLKTSDRAAHIRRASKNNQSIHALVQMTASNESVDDLLNSSIPHERIKGINRMQEYRSFSDQVEKLVHMAIADEDVKVRFSALSRLSSVRQERLNDKQRTLVLDCARVILKDPEVSCQAGAADVITGLGLSEAFDDLIELYNTTSDLAVKFTVIAGLGEMGEVLAFDFLKGVVETEGDDGEMLLLIGAIGSLGELGDQRAIPVIEKYVHHEYIPLRERTKVAVESLSVQQSTS